MVIRHQSRQKRGAGRVLGESAFMARDREASTAQGSTGKISKEPTPEDAARLTDAFKHLLSKLHDPTLVEIALLRLKGHTSEKISAELAMSIRTVDRKFRLIRAI
jgi:DNA-directed RNA polymerase specialized sigma24 family protein